MAGDIGSLNYGDRVYFDAGTGVAGIEWPVGTPQLPSSVIADVITICTARNLRNIDVHGALQLLATMEHYCFFGHCHESIADVMDLNGQDVDNSRFDNCVITGAQGGTLLATYIACILYNMSGFRGMAENCAIYTPLAVSTGVSDFDHCTSLHGVITVTVGNPTRLSFKNFRGGMILTLQTDGVALLRDFSGSLEIDAMIGGTLDIHANGADITINADCDAPSEINIWGNARVTIVGAPGATITDYTKETQLDGMETKISYTETSVSGATVNAWADALDVDTRGMKSMSAIVKNTDVANSLNWRIRARPSNYASGADEEIPECPGEETLAFGEKGLMELMKAYSRIKIQVQSTVAGTPADYTIDYLINR